MKKPNKLWRISISTKFDLKMKLTTLLLLAVLIQLNANTTYSQNTRITLNMTGATVEDVLTEIESKTEFKFFVDTKRIDVKRKVTINERRKRVSKILEKIFSGTAVTYEVFNKQIILKNEEVENLAATPTKKIPEKESEVPQQTISGTIIDANEEPLPGATVLEKGTTNGTQTDFDGRFSMVLTSADAVLQVSYIGFQTQEVVVGNQTTLNIQLRPEVAALDEVVILGYAQQKRVNLTGAVSTISNELIEERPVPNATNLLTGLAPGLSATQASGGVAGGGDPIIRIRGIGTLNNANPLILVDGTPSSINDVNPVDIQNISILKDASAAAIYGSRAANGVILITTKRASTGLSIQYQTFSGFQQVGRRPDLINDPILWMELKNEARSNGDLPVLFAQEDIDDYRANLGTDPVRYPSTDWFDVLAGDAAFMTSHTLTIDGGSEKNRVRTSLNYLNQDGIGLKNSLKRYNIRINSENKLSKNLNLGANLFVSVSDITPIVEGETNGFGQQAGFRHMGMQNMPIIPAVQAPDGRWGDAQVAGAGTIVNWVALGSVTQDELIRQNVQGQLYAEWDIFKDLRFDARFAINYVHNQRNQFIGLIPTGTLWNFNTESGAPTDRGERAFAGTNSNRLFTNYYTLTYTKSLAEKHNFKVLVGYQEDRSQFRENTGSIREFASNNTPVLSAGLEAPAVNESLIRWGLLSYFGRFNYDFKNKYLFEANVRYDGSSRFREGKKWGAFPSFSAGWRVSEESFLRDSDFLNEFKIRGSWGQLGNQQINAYPYQATYSVNETYSFGGQVFLGVAQNEIANPDIEWETTTTWNIGADMSFANGRINIAADYFNRETDGILVRQEIPDYLGDKTAPFENLAVVVNDGFEIDVSYRDRIGDLSFQIGANLTKQNNELTNYLSDLPFISNSNGVVTVLQEGQPINSFFGFKSIGVYQNEEEIANGPEYDQTPSPGDLIFEDNNGRDEDGNLTGQPDGFIDEADRTIIGNQVPEYLVGGNLNLGYKNFDLSVVVQGVFNVDTWTGLSGAFWPLEKEDRGQIHSLWLNRWTPENPSTELPRLISNGAYSQNELPSSFFVEDNSYLRVRNITLGYNFPSKFLETLKLSNLRLYLSGENLFTFSNFMDKWGWDPEREPQQFDVRIPNVRTIVLGANVTF